MTQVRDMERAEDVAVETLLNLQSVALKVEAAVSVLQAQQERLENELIDLRNLIIGDGNGIPAQVSGLKNSVDALRKEVHVTEGNVEHLEKRISILESYETDRQSVRDKWGDFIRSSLAGVVPFFLIGILLVGFQAYLYIWYRIPVQQTAPKGSTGT